MLFSSKLRVGLKEMEVTLKAENVQEFDGDFRMYLPDSKIEEMKIYNIHDVEATELLLNKCTDDIKLRLNIEEEYHISVLSKDGVNIGMKIIAEEYMRLTGKRWSEIKDLRSPCDMINLNEVILPYIQYKTPLLQNLLTLMKSQIVSPGRKGFEKHIIFDGLEYCVSIGGLHSMNKPEIIIPKDDEVLVDIDVALTQWRK